MSSNPPLKTQSGRITPVWNADDFADHVDVPRGTLDDFSLWYGLLRKWNARINLVAPKEIEQFWHRHAYDSWQLNAYLPETWDRLVDLGSGGGFPGLSFGIFSKLRGYGNVHLVESIGKKTSFLKTVTRELDLPITVHTARVEDLDPLEADVLTARAFAPLPRLFDYAAPHRIIARVDDGAGPVETVLRQKPHEAVEVDAIARRCFIGCFRHDIGRHHALQHGVGGREHDARRLRSRTVRKPGERGDAFGHEIGTGRNPVIGQAIP